MIAGFGGELISHAYLEDQLRGLRNRDRLVPFERQLVRWWRRAAQALGPASSTRAIHDIASAPLLELLDHERPPASPDPAGVASLIPRSTCVLLTVPWTTPTAAIWREAIRRGLAGDAPWALITNGRSLRIVDCTRPWTRAAIEFDFERLTASPDGIAALWLLARAAALSSKCDASLRSHVGRSDAHASGVCRALSDGVLSALPSLTAALAPARSRGCPRASLDQALTLVYRILFLLFAEARALVPVWNDLYRDAYTIDALTARASRPGPSPVATSRYGLWESLQAISRLAHAGCLAGDLTVTAFNGRLFSPRHAPLVEQRKVPDTIVRDVLLSLATQQTRSGRRRISYYDLGVEQLGTVYERVLEYEPATNSPIVVLERTSTQRKATGSFYTPQALTEFLVRRTLAPLVEGRTADDILRLRIVDPAMGSGAFLVACCRYLADACEQALVRDGLWSHADDLSSARAALRRSIAERCLYGVDLNPTAVQLARVSLWLTTLAADRPLTFLDHHLSVGNSLIGAWLGDLSRPPRASRAREAAALPLFDMAIADEVSTKVLPERLRIALEPSDTVDAVRCKERLLADLTRDDGPLSKWSAAADAWCAGGLWRGPAPSNGLVAEWIAAVTGGATTLPAPQLRGSLKQARALAAEHAAFHWELEFPEVFFDAHGRRSEHAGFDAVIGNPPWDMMRADTGSAAQRDRDRDMTASAMHFLRTSRLYTRLGNGHPNRYQLFMERALQLTRRGGRMGLLLPSGIATDHGSGALRRHLFDRTTIDTWIGFDNRRRIFPIHRSVRFVLLSATNQGTTETLTFRCGVTDPAELHRDAAGAPLAISRSRLEALNPEHITIPEVSSATALSILTGVADRVPALGAAAGWSVRFGRELNATDDRKHFVARSARGRILPIVEGKQLAPFQVDLERSTLAIPETVASRLLGAGAMFNRDRIAYRDVASATNKLTLIAAMLPAATVSTHTVFCLKTPLDAESQWALLGLMNSLVANYLVRLQVTTHVTAALMSRLPVPKPPAPLIAQLAALARQLAASGIDQSIDDYAILNALGARLYGVTTGEYAFILDSFPLMPKPLLDRCRSVYSGDNSRGNTETQQL